MGDHPHHVYCASDGSNVGLQERLASELGLIPNPGAEESVDLVVDSTLVGKASMRVYVGPDDPTRQLYFTCITWGEVGRTVKQTMLRLDGEFHETNANDPHQAHLNRQLKRFVNRSFSDPVIYVGPLGSMIRRAMWEGIQKAGSIQSQHRQLLNPETHSPHLTGAMGWATSTSFYRDEPTVLLTDSLGSRVIFDTLCEFGANCGAKLGDAVMLGDGGEEGSSLAESMAGSIVGVFMFANQLPFLELASIPVPPPDVSLGAFLPGDQCFLAHAGQMPGLGERDRGPVDIVAFTDVNDPLSYHIDEDFRRRCGGPDERIRFINVTLPNARLRWFFVLTHPGKAHANGFKNNTRAIRYLVDGNS
jgi:hypothetical protein